MFNATLPATQHVGSKLTKSPETLQAIPDVTFNPFFLWLQRPQQQIKEGIWRKRLVLQQRPFVPAFSHVPCTQELRNKPMFYLPTHLPFFQYIHLIDLQHILIFCLLASKGTQLLFYYRMAVCKQEENGTLPGGWRAWPDITVPSTDALWLEEMGARRENNLVSKHPCWCYSKCKEMSKLK